MSAFESEINLSIHETSITYPEPAPRYLIESTTANGWEILAICETESEAIKIYDRLNNKEAKYVYR